MSMHMLISFSPYLGNSMGYYRRGILSRRPTSNKQLDKVDRPSRGLPSAYRNRVRDRKDQKGMFRNEIVHVSNGAESVHIHRTNRIPKTVELTAKTSMFLNPTDCKASIFILLREIIIISTQVGSFLISWYYENVIGTDSHDIKHRNIGMLEETEVAWYGVRHAGAIIPTGCQGRNIVKESQLRDRCRRRET